MTKSTKYIHMIGLQRKELMLIQSFVDLINDDLDLDYQLDLDLKQKPDLFIVDELSHHDEINAANPKAPILVVGDDIGNPDKGYLPRPLQWSRFKSIIDLISRRHETTTVESGLTQIVEVDGADEDRHGAKSFRSHTVASFKANIDAKTNKEKVDRINSASSAIANTAGQVAEGDSDVDLTVQYKGLNRLGANIEFWGDQDCQVVVGGKAVFFVLPQREMVYSEHPITDWEILLRSRDARKALLPDQWQPTGRMRSFPIRWLTWFSSHARSKGYLLRELNKDDFFLLKKWPEFDLLYNNNEHLKLCGLMFKEGHSIQELVSKTHLRARVVIGLINACHKLGVLASFPDKDSARPKINQPPIDANTVMSLLSKVFKS